jgi:hypothetical protein
MSTTKILPHDHTLVIVPRILFHTFPPSTYTVLTTPIVHNLLIGPACQDANSTCHPRKSSNASDNVIETRRNEIEKKRNKNVKRKRKRPKNSGRFVSPFATRIAWQSKNSRQLVTIGQETRKWDGLRLLGVSPLPFHNIFGPYRQRPPNRSGLFLIMLVLIVAPPQWWRRMLHHQQRHKNTVFSTFPSTTFQPCYGWVLQHSRLQGSSITTL